MEKLLLISINVFELSINSLNISTPIVEMHSISLKLEKKLEHGKLGIISLISFSPIIKFQTGHCFVMKMHILVLNLSHDFLVYFPFF